ncbi:hypothetical protein [Psychromicrobium xiongbiense]|uniref:hypothetical protein n=1 Tax=Psychromicrobium xiongbiense TaxID=3051184 RepID=UPI00255275EA|nr:hypothetical protein [Psychromicrobium sp. YIM S02556]
MPSPLPGAEVQVQELSLDLPAQFPGTDLQLYLDRHHAPTPYFVGSRSLASCLAGVPPLVNGALLSTVPVPVRPTYIGPALLVRSGPDAGRIDPLPFGLHRLGGPAAAIPLSGVSTLHHADLRSDPSGLFLIPRIGALRILVEGDVLAVPPQLLEVVLIEEAAPAGLPAQVAAHDAAGCVLAVACGMLPRVSRPESVTLGRSPDLETPVGVPWASLDGLHLAGEEQQIRGILRTLMSQLVSAGCRVELRNPDPTDPARFLPSVRLIPASYGYAVDIWRPDHVAGEACARWTVGEGTTRPTTPDSTGQGPTLQCQEGLATLSQDGRHTTFVPDTVSERSFDRFARGMARLHAAA